MEDNDKTQQEVDTNLYEESFKIKNKDTGETFDIRIKEDIDRLNETLEQFNKVFLNSDKGTWGYYYLYKEKLKHKFYYYCDKGDIKKVTKMLDKNNAPDRIPNINEKYTNSYTVLHRAIDNKNYELVNLLLDYGAFIEAETDLKRTPLHIAVLVNDIKIVNILVNCGASIDCLDFENNTPMHYASRMGYLKIIEILLKTKARCDIKNIQGESPLDIVSNTRTIEVFKRFIEENEINSMKNSYSRTIHKNYVLHNNRADNLREIIFREKKIINKYLEAKRIKSRLTEFKADFTEAVNLDSFNFLELIGKGSFGEVYLVELKTNNKKYAMKVLQKKRLVEQNIMRYIITEKNVLSRVKNPFIVRLYFSFQTEEYLYLIMEYCPNGDLSKYLKQQKGFPEEMIRIIAAQILLALEELHKLDIIYRDLKPENIVLDENFYVKLTDFGLSKEGISKNDSTKSFCGSLAYLAPEVIDRIGHGKAFDWYLFGVLLYELFFCLPPYYTNLSKEALFHNIKNAKMTFPFTISSDAENLITNLLNRNPDKRLGSTDDAEDIKRHEFFRTIDFEKIYLKMFDPPVLKLKTNFFTLAKSKINKNNKIFISKKLEESKNNVKNWTYIINNNTEETNDEKSN